MPILYVSPPKLEALKSLNANMLRFAPSLPSTTTAGRVPVKMMHVTLPIFATLRVAKEICRQWKESATYCSRSWSVLLVKNEPTYWTSL